MLTIWSRIIQTLILSDDDRAQLLGMALVDDKKDVYRWWAQADDEIATVALSMIPMRMGPVNDYSGYCSIYEHITTEDCLEQLKVKWKRLNKRKTT